MRRLILPLRARPRLMTSVGLGLAAALFTPGLHGPVSRGLFGWNVMVWLYLGLVAVMMLRADRTRLRRIARAHADGAATVLAMVVIAALVSLLGTVVELSAAKQPGTPHAVPHVLFALVTVVGSWLLTATKFTLTYASLFHAAAPPGGLMFPDDDAGFSPGYGDFLYFAFTIAVASQTADVVVCSARMRRLVLLQSLLSFAFNTAVLAFTVNVAASLF